VCHLCWSFVGFFFSLRKSPQFIRYWKEGRDNIRKQMDGNVKELKDKGNALFEQGDSAGASAVYTEALSYCTEDDREIKRILHSNRSAARLKAGDAEGALKDSEICLVLGPSWSKGYARRAAALFRLGRFQDAAKSYEQALLGDPFNVSLQDGLAKAKLAAADPSAAERIRQEASQAAARLKEDNNSKTPQKKDVLAAFLDEVAEIESSTKTKVTQVDHETETAGWTTVNQIDRILQKHYKFLNLNPYHVFGIAHHANEEDIKKRYHRLSSLVHPDKNQQDLRAREAFDYVTRAYDELRNENRRSLLLQTFDICRASVEQARAGALVALGNREDLLIQKEGTFQEAFEREIKKTLALNEQNRIKAEQIRTTNEERIAKSQMAKEPNWADVKKQQDERKESADVRTKSWMEFNQSKRHKG
jgi:tetratricopeptide (TPR) repeat protein